MNLHRVKHIPSGLYYQPGENNFSEKGKIYQNNHDVLIGNWSAIGISMKKNSRIFKKYTKVFEEWEDDRCSYGRGVFKILPKSEFEREPISL